MPGDFQVICGSIIGENRRSPVSTETPASRELHVKVNNRNIRTGHEICSKLTLKTYC